MAQDVNKNTDAFAALQSPPQATSNQDAVASESEVCVICLETISEQAVALPCRHDGFDFPCLGNWLMKHKTCPLCKREVEKLEYEFNGAGEFKTFYLPLAEPDQVSHSSGPTHGSHQSRDLQRRIRTQPFRHDRIHFETEGGLILERRRSIYRNQLFSSHVGTNRISRYRDLNAHSFRDDDVLLSRARKWIRRELQVFDFLKIDCTAPGNGRHRANNAEFLLEYVIAILKTTDINDSGGHAEELLKDFLGRDNTRVFLHELRAWLRSPYQHLRDWDRTVQYIGLTLRLRDPAVSHVETTTRSDSTSSCSLSSRHPPATQYYRYIPH